MTRTRTIAVDLDDVKSAAQETAYDLLVWSDVEWAAIREGIPA